MYLIAFLFYCIIGGLRARAISRAARKDPSMVDVDSTMYATCMTVFVAAWPLIVAYGFVSVLLFPEDE